MSEINDFSCRKRRVEVGEATIAYLDEGEGVPVLLLHGCPFSNFVWRNVIPVLAPEHRCLAPDLLGLGDTETRADADWSVRAQAEMVLGFIDALDLGLVEVVGHDQGGAIAQVLAAEHAHRVNRLVLSNAEAYDNWPSAHERPYVKATQLPLLGRLAVWLGSRPRFLRWELASAGAVSDPAVLDAGLLQGYIRANAGSAARRARLRRYLGLQLDPANNRATLELLDGLRRFEQPTLLLWGEADPHFGPQWAEQLERDIPGPVELRRIPGAGHLVMEDRPGEFADALREFLAP
jgi:pimeloyl-ACP methyl ester carboxylesterase